MDSDDTPADTAGRIVLQLRAQQDTRRNIDDIRAIVLRFQMNSCGIRMLVDHLSRSRLRASLPTPISRKLSE